MVDLVYTPLETRLLADAAACGAVAVDGLGMLVNQGVVGFRYWTGVDPDPEVMREALQEVFGE